MFYYRGYRKAEFKGQCTYSVLSTATGDTVLRSSKGICGQTRMTATGEAVLRSSKGISGISATETLFCGVQRASVSIQERLLQRRPFYGVQKASVEYLLHGTPFLEVKKGICVHTRISISVREGQVGS